MIEQRITNSLKELEQSLKNIDSARKQVEKTVSTYEGLSDATSNYVNSLGVLTTKVKELITIIDSDYSQKAATFENNCKLVVDSANISYRKLSETIELFGKSLNNVEKKLKYCLIINAISFMVLIGVLIVTVL